MTNGYTTRALDDLSDYEVLPAYQPPNNRHSSSREIDACLKPTSSLPACQFRSQAQRQEQRLIHLYSVRSSVREKPLPYDERLSFMANAENNVRSEWVEQGIWQDSWGPAWSPHTQQGKTKKGPSGSGPWPSGRWTHERQARPEPEPTPEPQVRDLFAPPRASHPKPPTSQPTARNPEASRPDKQFRYQVSKECDWLAFGLRRNGRSLDREVIEMCAHDNIVEFWKKSNIWDDDWGHKPGKTWSHEPKHLTRLPTPPTRIPTPPVDSQPPSYEEATRTRPSRGLKRKAESAPVRRSARIAAQNVRKATEQAPRRSKRLRKV